MSHTITVRLTRELAEWLEKSAAQSGRAQGQIVRDELERARDRSQEKRFMRLAGQVSGPANLSKRRGFSRQ
jgi:predicted DNA-binding protein